MAERRYDLWVHGAQAQIQQHSAAFDPDLAQVNVRKNSNGATIVKARNDGEVRGFWCHMIIPTPTMLRSHSVRLDRFYLTGRVNGQATVDKIHIYQGGAPDKNRILRLDDLSLSARELNEEFVVPDVVADGDSPGTVWVKFVNKPCIMCIYIELEDDGEVTIGGAAGSFWERG